MFDTIRFHSHAHSIVNLASQIIHRYEYGCGPTCKPDLLAAIRASIKANRSTVTAWDPNSSSCYKLVHLLLIKESLALLSTGRYHSAPGVLDPAGNGPALVRVYRSAVTQGCSMHYLTEDQQAEKLRQLDDVLSSAAPAFQADPSMQTPSRFSSFLGNAKGWIVLILNWLFSAVLYFVPLLVFPKIRWLEILYTFLFVLNVKQLSGIACIAAYCYALIIVFQFPYLTRAHLIILPCFLAFVVRTIVLLRRKD